MADQRLVRRVCVAVAHVVAHLGQARRGVVPASAAMTIVDKEWAFCPAGASDGHEWLPLEPRLGTFDALVFAARTVDAP